MSRRFFRTPGTVTIISFIVLFTGLVLWTSLTVLDYGVHAEGVVASLNPNVLIQHREVARAVKIYVEEGAHVKAGQTLLKLDNSDALAEAHKAVAQQLLIRIQYEALKAERNGSGTLPMPRWNSPLLTGDFVRQVVRDAEFALQQRISTHQAQMDTFLSEQESGKEVLAKLRAGLEAVEAQIKTTKGQLEKLRPLVEEKLVARTVFEEQENRLAEARKAQASILAEMERTQGMVAQSQNKQRAYLSNRRNELDKAIAELALQLESSEKLMEATSARLSLYEINSPVDGQVVNLKINAPGEIVRPGETIMEIVPDDRQYFIDAKVLPAEIEAVREVGQHALIHFVTLPSKSTPKVDGRLLSIASSATTDEKTGQRYYIARIGLTGDVEKLLGTRLTLGMPVQVLLKGGQRSVISYIIDPFKILFMRAMKEQ